MSISDRLDEIGARAQVATPADAETSLSMDGFDMHEDYPEYGQGQLMNAYMLGYGDGREDKPAMLAALRAVLDLCDKALAVKVSGASEGDAAMAAFAAAARSAITAALGEES